MDIINNPRNDFNQAGLLDTWLSSKQYHSSLKALVTAIIEERRLSPVDVQAFLVYGLCDERGDVSTQVSAWYGRNKVLIANKLRLQINIETPTAKEPISEHLNGAASDVCSELDTVGKPKTPIRLSY